MPAKSKKRVMPAVVAHLALLHSASKGKDSAEPKPWRVIIPSLGICVSLVDENGDSVTGYIEKTKASVMVQTLANELLNDAEYFTTLRSSPEQVVLGGLWDQLGTIISVPVYIPENFSVT